MSGVGSASEKRFCDIFIAGAGIVGSTFARMLVDSGAHVIMVDAGNYHSHRAGENKKNDWVYQRDLVQYGHFVRGQMIPVASRPFAPPHKSSHPSEDTSYPSAVVSYAVGGMAVHWTCAIPEYHERLERMSYISASEWRELYDKAALLLNKHLDVFSGSARHQVLKRHIAAAGWPVLDTPMAAERLGQSEFVKYTGADTVLGGLAVPNASKMFQIVPEHCVRCLVRSAKNPNAVEYAEVQDIKTGALARFYAKTFVVSAGWLHTAQILWASDIYTHEGSALGRYMSDHTFAACTVVLKKSVLDAIAAKAGQGGSGEQRELDIWGIPLGDPPPHLYIPISEERPWHGMIFRESFQFDPLPGNFEDHRGVDLKWFGTIDPVRENGVTFSCEKVDRLHMPQATFHIRLGENDRNIQTRMMADMQALAGILGEYRSGAEPNFAPLGSAIHATGLTRMGAQNDGGTTSVVDPSSKVWGIDNLYLGGNSVIPTRSASNPTLTSVALAIRAGQMITARA